MFYYKKLFTKKKKTHYLNAQISKLKYKKLKKIKKF